MYETNPRFPHSLVVKRPKKVNGEIVFDNDGLPTYEVVNLSIVAMSGGVMLRDSQGKPVIGSTASSIAFGYRGSARATSEDRDVVVYQTEIHTPAFTTELFYDDLLVMTDYDRTYNARMVRKTTTNFGTNIWIDEIKN